jgi:biopolymer transport protein ExbB
MATTQKTASPKKSQGFQGIRAAFWVIVACFIIAVCIFKYLLGNPANFVGNDPAGAVLNGNLLGTIYKGGIVVPVIHTLLLTVIALSIERALALRTAFGKGSLTKFVANIKAALNANDFGKAQQLCDKQRGSVANVVSASLNAYKEMEGANGLKRNQKVAKIQQAHEEATQLEMPTLQMNLPILATIVTLGTLTGLLGTVTGMIKSFAALAAGGGGDSLQLSTGISEALINTAFGILTSWCAVISYNYFTNKIDKLTYALDEVGYSIAQTYEANHAEEA